MSQSMSQHALHFFLEQNKNCAEALLLGADAALHLGLSPQVVRAIGPFGGGMGCGESCGALCGALAALGVRHIDETGAHACPDAKLAAAEMTGRFLEAFGTLRCEELKPRFFTEERRCALLLERTAALLEELCAQLPPTLIIFPGNE